MNSQKTIRLMLLALILLLALAACGGGDTGSDTSSQDTTSTNAATTTPPNPTYDNVSLKDTKIVPSLTTFSPGIPYRFIVANVGKKDHGFVILLSALNVAQMSKDDLHKAALIIIDNLTPHQSMIVDYTFPASALGQNYEMTSPMPADFQAGLKVSITVTAKK